jgi:hypothetical protein
LSPDKSRTKKIKSKKYSEAKVEQKKKKRKRERNRNSGVQLLFVKKTLIFLLKNRLQHFSKIAYFCFGMEVCEFS